MTVNLGMLYPVQTQKLFHMKFVLVLVMMMIGKLMYLIEKQNKKTQYYLNITITMTMLSIAHLTLKLTEKQLQQVHTHNLDLRLKLMMVKLKQLTGKKLPLMMMELVMELLVPLLLTFHGMTLILESNITLDVLLNLKMETVSWL